MTSLKAQQVCGLKFGGFDGQRVQPMRFCMRESDHGGYCKGPLIPRPVVKSPSRATPNTGERKP